jgi:hypothetical protein
MKRTHTNSTYVRYSSGRAVLVRAHAALVLYDANICQQLVLAVLVYEHAALALYDADA